MTYDPNRHHRRSIRLPGYDYRQTGAYFVTICVHGGAHLFGRVAGNALLHTAAGEMVTATWQALPQRFPHVTLVAEIVMPNHIHGVLQLEQHGDTSPLGAVVGAFKSLTTNAYIAGVREQGWPSFTHRLWLRNYYEHIVRDEADLARICTYIAHNPARWGNKH